ncbi:hypothetical protein GCM10010387_12340 [Streptomyces inusitatus]|uniref:Integral membrane protein n=1 Tax=Streptomyces inusitatus TaxID=68221 RepID=A0A918PS53_9ACTN|nr:hypothetical protein [Streptomyces inusitatus]GGZ20888.1 hypothetical protein GCM10010387_12340 [Streptomyces inusitatus]
MTDARSPLRALRAALFTAICVSLAAMGHAFASGHDIPLPALLGALPVTAAAGWLAAARRRGAVSIGLGLLAGQGALHLYFAGTQMHGPPPGGGGHHAGAAVQAALPDPGLLGQSTITMVVAHLAAAAVCGLWLARGEKAFLRLAEAVAAFAFAPLRLLLAVVALPSAPAVPLRERPANTRSRDLLLGHSLVRRGPPGFDVPRATAPEAAA